VETRWSVRGYPGAPSDSLARLKSLALGPPGEPRTDGLDLTVTNPEVLGLVWPRARDIVARASRVPYLPEAAGPRRAREAIIGTYRERLAGRVDRISADDVFVTASTSESYSFLLHALCDPGDSVLVPRPSYPLLPDLARLADVRVLPYDVRYAGHFQIDPSSLPGREEMVRKRVRAVVVVSPNNPTGHFTSEDELALVASLGVPLIVDEVFRPFSFRERGLMADPLTQPGPMFLLDGLSKRAGLSGLKAGWIAVVGATPFKERARARLEAIADTFLGVSATAQNALPELLAQGGELGAALCVRLRENLELLRALVRSSPLTLLEPDGGWSAILRLPAVRSEESYFEELAAAGVWAQPGALYDLPLAPCFVVSLLCPPEQLRAGMSRLLELTPQR
jgi:alanine-synthesizing transaminase